MKSGVPLVRRGLSVPLATLCACVYQATCVCPGVVRGLWQELCSQGDRTAAAEPGGCLTDEYLQDVCFYLASARTRKHGLYQHVGKP